MRQLMAQMGFPPFHPLHKMRSLPFQQTPKKRSPDWDVHPTKTVNNPYVSLGTHTHTHIYIYICIYIYIYTLVYPIDKCLAIHWNTSPSHCNPQPPTSNPPNHPPAGIFTGSNCSGCASSAANSGGMWTASLAKSLGNSASTWNQLIPSHAPNKNVAKLDASPSIAILSFTKDWTALFSAFVRV